MIEYRKMDITTVEHGIIAHGVNCQRRMGSGVALAIRMKFPKAYYSYMDNLHPTLGAVNFAPIDQDLVVANCYTQDRYGRDGKVYASLSAIRNCLETIVYMRLDEGAPVYMPRIGCGLGGLKWEDVERIIPQTDIKFIVCEL